MIEIIRFFSKYSPWVYLILGIGFLLALRKLLLDMREKRDLVFGLEREITNQRIGQSVASLIMIGLILVGEFILVVFLAPGLPAISLLTTPTVNPLLIPQSSINPSQLTIIAQTPIANSTQEQSSGCIPGQIMFTEPVGGQIIQGKITLVGTAVIPNFGFYKYEYTLQGNTTWSTILASREQVINGELGYWDTSELTPGDYQLRLVVSDNTGTELPACIVPVQINK
jgi:hypothetical protein